MGTEGSRLAPKVLCGSRVEVILFIHKGNVREEGSGQGIRILIWIHEACSACTPLGGDMHLVDRRQEHKTSPTARAHQQKRACGSSPDPRAKCRTKSTPVMGENCPPVRLFSPEAVSLP